jgi:hypothetical protein
VGVGGGSGPRSQRKPRVFARAALRCAVHAGGDGKMHKGSSETLCRDAPGDGVAADTSSHQRRVLLRGYVLAAGC